MLCLNMVSFSTLNMFIMAALRSLFFGPPQDSSYLLLPPPQPPQCWAYTFLFKTGHFKSYILMTPDSDPLLLGMVVRFCLFLSFAWSNYVESVCVFLFKPVFLWTALGSLYFSGQPVIGQRLY